MHPLNRALGTVAPFFAAAFAILVWNPPFATQDAGLPFGLTLRAFAIAIVIVALAVLLLGVVLNARAPDRPRHRDEAESLPSR